VPELAPDPAEVVIPPAPTGSSLAEMVHDATSNPTKNTHEKPWKKCAFVIAFALRLNPTTQQLQTQT
jgi:hypothetical protein